MNNQNKFEAMAKKQEESLFNRNNKEDAYGDRQEGKESEQGETQAEKM